MQIRFDKKVILQSLIEIAVVLVLRLLKADKLGAVRLMIRLQLIRHHGVYLIHQIHGLTLLADAGQLMFLALGGSFDILDWLGDNGLLHIAQLLSLIHG